MKRTVKILIFGGAAFFIGLVLWIAGMSVIGWNFTRLDATEYTARSYACEGEVSGISVNLSSFPLTVKKGDSVSLDYYEADNSEVFVEEKDGKLSVVEKHKYNPFKSGIFEVGRRSHKFTLTVVSGVTFEISGTNGDISFADVDFESFTIDITNADVHFSGVEFGKLDMDIDNADIEFENCTVGELNIVGKNTDCDLTDVTSDSLFVHTVNADIGMTGCNIGELSVDATNLDIKAQSCEFKSVMLDGTNTDCGFRRVTLDRLTVDTVNLDATIEIVGTESEYTVRTDGRGMPSDRTGSTDKLIELSGVNNDVKLKFVQ